MNSILRNVSVLKTTLAHKQSSSLNILESSIFPKISRNSFRPLLLVKHLKYSTFSSDRNGTKFSKYYSSLDVSKTKDSPSSLTRISYKTNQKFRRFFCQTPSKKSERDIRRRQLDKKDHPKKDKICIEDCITSRKEKCKKKNVPKKGDIKFTVNLNNIINEMNRKKTLEKQHEINKINNFIFKPIACKSCSQKRRSSSKKSSHVNHQKRTNSSYSVTKKIYPRYEKKHEKFQRQSYDETITFKPRLELLALLNECKHGKGPLIVKEKKSSTNMKNNSTVPLFLLVKCNSSRSKINDFTRNVQYKVGTNEAFVKVYNDVKKSGKSCLSLENQHRPINNQKETTRQIANFEPAKSKEKRLQLYQSRTGMNNQTSKPLLAQAIYEMLRPLIEQEYLQYKEVKEAIERLERNLQYHFNKNRNTGFESELYKSLSNINQLRTGQSQLNIPDKNNNEINDPKMNLEIMDPFNTNYRKRDPSTDCTISDPSIKKENISDPFDNKITIITKDCDTNTKNDKCKKKKTDSCEKEDPCKKDEDPCKKKEDPCKKKEDPCKKKEDPCKKKEDPCKKKKDPCKKDEDPCKKKEDPCGKKDCNKNGDPCKKKEACKKEDPCKKKKDSCKMTDCSKTEDQCANKKKKNLLCDPMKDVCGEKKKDPCKNDQKYASCEKTSCNQNHTSTSGKDDDCFKPVANLGKTPKFDSGDCSCVKPKRKADDFAATSTSCNMTKKPTCKRSTQSCENKKEDPCMNFMERSKPAQDPCGKCSKQQDDSCKKFNDDRKSDRCEQKKVQDDCMRPSEVTCQVGEPISPRPCCEKVSICEEPKLPMIKPKCGETLKSGSCKKEAEKKPGQCKQVPMPTDCPMKICPEETAQQSREVSCTQKSCTQKSMEPTEPPNCCKTRPTSTGKECFPTFEGQQVVRERPEIKQVSCQKLQEERERAAARNKQPPCPPPPPPVKQEKPKCPPLSKTDIRHCRQKTKKEKKYVPEQAPPAKVLGKQRSLVEAIPCPKAREPRQVPKDTWAPVKVRGKKVKAKDLRDTRSLPCSKVEKSSESTSPPKSSYDQQNEECNKKGFLESCKGIVSSVYKVICPGKNKKSGGKKAASLGLIRSLSLPEIKGLGLSGGTLSGSSGNNYRKKKPGTMCFAHYKTKDKYPWRNTNRWIKRKERFYSKNHKKSDPCDTKKEEEEDAVPESEKLNCICHEEMKKSKTQSEDKDNCGEKSGSEQQKESTKRLNFKLTDHSKICQTASRNKASSKNKKCDSEPNQDQSLFCQCGELCKHMKSGSTMVEIVESDKTKCRASSAENEKKPDQKQSCLNKKKTGCEAKGKEDEAEKNLEQKKSCIDKMKSNTEELSKKQDMKNSCTGNTKSNTEQKKSCLDKIKQNTDGDNEVKNSCLNKLKATSETEQKKRGVCQKQKESSVKKKPNSALRQKYPWQKSEVKMDAELCPNQSDITTQSSKSRKRDINKDICSKLNKGTGKETTKKDPCDTKKDPCDTKKDPCDTEKEDDSKKKKFSLEVEKDPACFKGQGKEETGAEKSQAKEIDCAKLDNKKSDKNDICSESKEGSSKEIQNEQKKNLLSVEKTPCCFQGQEKKKQRESDCTKKNQGQSIDSGKSHAKENTCSKSKIGECGKEAKKKEEKYGKCLKESHKSKPEQCGKEITDHKKKKGALCADSNEKQEDECNKRKGCLNAQKSHDGDKHKKGAICSGNETDCEKVGKSKSNIFNKETSVCPEKDEKTDKNVCEKISKTEKKDDAECKEVDIKNLLENYTKKVEEMLQKCNESSEDHKKTCESKSHSDVCKMKDEKKNVCKSTKSTGDFCSELKKKQSGEEKAKKGVCKDSMAPKKAAPGKIDAVNLSDIMLDGNEDDVFICKVKKLGKSEQFICNPKGSECEMSNEQEKGVVRVLKCKLTKDDCGRDVFVCKEIKSNAVESESKEDEHQKMKKVLKQRSNPEMSKKYLSISKKLICTEGMLRDENNEAAKEKICNIREVREIIEGKENKKESCENSNKKSPFTYKDLLKKSEELRKKGNAECMKREKQPKEIDCKDKLKTR